MLYGKRALICVEPAALAKHGEGAAALDGEDSSATADLTAAERQSLILSFYSHAAPLLPRMCRATGEVGAMEGKGAAGPRTSEVYMCSEVCQVLQHHSATCVDESLACHLSNLLLPTCVTGFLAGGSRTHPGDCFCTYVAVSAALRPCALGRGAYRQPSSRVRQTGWTVTLRHSAGSSRTSPDDIWRAWVNYLHGE